MSIELVMAIIEILYAFVWEDGVRQESSDYSSTNVGVGFKVTLPSFRLFTLTAIRGTIIHPSMNPLRKVNKGNVAEYHSVPDGLQRVLSMFCVFENKSENSRKKDRRCCLKALQASKSCLVFLGSSSS